MWSGRGNSLVVQGLGVSAFTARGLGSIHGQGTKILQALWLGKKKKERKKNFKLNLRRIQRTHWWVPEAEGDMREGG